MKKAYLNPVQEPAVVGDGGSVPPEDDVGDFIRVIDILAADSVRVRGATLVVVDERLVQACLLGHLSGRIDQLHIDGGFGAGTEPVAGGDFGQESGHSKHFAYHGCGG